MQFNELLAAMATTIKERLPSLKTCTPHDGRFDLAELTRISAKAPAVLTACLGVADMKSDAGGEWDATLILAAYVVTKHGKNADRAEQARDLAEALLLLVAAERWGLDYVDDAEQIRADNLHAAAVGKVGVALWAVSWRQKVRLGEPRWGLIDGELSQVLASHSPDIGIPHEPDYELITEAPEAPEVPE